MAGCAGRVLVVVFDLDDVGGGFLPGRRVAGAGPGGGASGLGVAMVGTEGLDDLDMLDSVLLRVELLLESLELPFLKKLKVGMACCEERFGEGAKGAG